jgi:hypothetical protein
MHIGLAAIGAGSVSSEPPHRSGGAVVQRGGSQRAARAGFQVPRRGKRPLLSEEV